MLYNFKIFSVSGFDLELDLDLSEVNSEVWVTR